MYGSERGFLVGIGVVVVVIIALILGANIATHIEHTTVATVCSKERVATSGGGEYRVYTADKGTFDIKDSHWPFTWRTNSADVYGQLHTPGTYEIKYIGVRIPLFSSFHNIMSYKKLPPNQQKIASCTS